MRSGVPVKTQSQLAVVTFYFWSSLSIREKFNYRMFIGNLSSQAILLYVQTGKKNFFFGQNSNFGMKKTANRL